MAGTENFCHRIRTKGSWDVGRFGRVIFLELGLGRHKPLYERSLGSRSSLGMTILFGWSFFGEDQPHCAALSCKANLLSCRSRRISILSRSSNR